MKSLWSCVCEVADVWSKFLPAALLVALVAFYQGIH